MRAALRKEVMDPHSNGLGPMAIGADASSGGLCGRVSMASSHTQCEMMAICPICDVVPPRLIDILLKRSSEMPAQAQNKATVLRTN
jgi:hypothetical protein